MDSDRCPNLDDRTSAYGFSRFDPIAFTEYDEEESTSDHDERDTVSSIDPIRRQEPDKRIGDYYSSRFNSIASTESDREERASDDNDWEELENYEAALNLNRSFLRGERQRTIYHEGPPEDGTRGIIQGLLRLHDYGILTHGSQPHDGELPTGVATWWAQTWQRSYVDFLLPMGDRISRGNLGLFCRLLSQHPKIVTLIEVNVPRLQPKMPKEFVLTKERVALTEREMYMASWKATRRLTLNQHDILRQYDVGVLD